jgi:multicomponent Na+:H+ antiporter subunit G
MREALSVTLLGLGSLIILLAALGMLRMPDSLTRMQVLTKGTTLGIILVMSGVGVHFAGGPEGLRALLVVLFLFLTTPISAHLLSRSAYWRKDSRQGMVLGEDSAPLPPAQPRNEHAS